MTAHWIMVEVSSLVLLRGHDLTHVKDDGRGIVTVMAHGNRPTPWG